MFTVAQLREMASKKKIEGRSKMNKAELQKALGLASRTKKPKKKSRTKKAEKGQDSKGKYYRWATWGKKFYYGPDKKLSAIEAKQAATDLQMKQAKRWLDKNH